MASPFFDVSSLSVRYGPYNGLPSLYLVFVGILVMGLFLWCRNWLSSQQDVPLQRHLSILPCIKLASMTLSWAFWVRCDPLTNNLDNTGNCDRNLFEIQKATEILFLVFLFMALLLLSKGLYVIRFSIDPTEKRTTIWNAMLLTVSLCGRSFLQSEYFLFPTALTLSVLVVHIYSGSAISLMGVEQYMAALATIDINPATTPVIFKALSLKKLQYAVATYLILLIVLQIEENLQLVITFFTVSLCNNSADIFILFELACIYRFRLDARSTSDAEGTTGDDDEPVNSSTLNTVDVLPTFSLNNISPSARANIRHNFIDSALFDGYAMRFDCPSLRTWNPSIDLPDPSIERPVSTRTPLVPLHVANQACANPSSRALSECSIVIVQNPTADTTAWTSNIAIGTNLSSVADFPIVHGIHKLNVHYSHTAASTAAAVVIPPPTELNSDNIMNDSLSLL